jgi:hypothetical protein
MRLDFSAMAEPAGNDPRWDASAQPGPEIEFDQRIAWQVLAGAKSKQAAARHGATHAWGAIRGASLRIATHARAT